MEPKIVLIHGYSDCSKSFMGAKSFLLNALQGTVKTILYADYESREDSLTFNDVADGLNDEFIRNKLINSNGENNDASAV